VDGPVWLSLGIVVALLGIAASKGTAPGGERQRASFEHEVSARRLVHGGGDDRPRPADIVEGWDRHRPTG
jgi:hypothetical protein